MTRYVRDSDGVVHAFEDNTPTDQIIRQIDRTVEAKRLTPTVTGMPPGTQPGGMQPLEGAPDMRMLPLSEEAQDYQRMSLVGGMSGNRALATAGSNLYEHDPSYLARKAAAEGAGKSAVDLSNRQAAGMRVVPGIGALRQMILNANDEDWQNAAGAYNSTPAPAANTVPLSREAWRAPDMTPTQARASYGYSWDNPDYQRQWKLQNDLEHLNGALTEQYITAMGKGAIANSDAKMNLFKDLMGRMRMAPDRKAAMDILNTAEDATHNTFSLNPKQSRAMGSSEASPIPIKNPADVKLFRVGTYFRLPDGSVGVKERE